MFHFRIRPCFAVNMRELLDAALIEDTREKPGPTYRLTALRCPDDVSARGIRLGRGSSPAARMTERIYQQAHTQGKAFNPTSERDAAPWFRRYRSEWMIVPTCSPSSAAAI